MEKSSIRSILFPAVLLLAIAAPAMTVSSQETTGSRPSFEVASIKPNRSVGVTFMPPIETDDYFAWTGCTLKSLIRYAYRVRDWQIEGEPGWVNSQRWDVEAKAEEKGVSAASKPRDPNARDAIKIMLQSLLEDRFKLRFQRQTKQSSVYNLVLAKGGAKITLDDDQSPPARPEWGTSLVQRGAVRATPDSIEGRAVPIAALVSILLSSSDRPVIDCTNLKGLYNFRMKWSLEDSGPAGSTGPSSPIADVNTNFGPALFTAIQEQLGLRLESAKAPVEFIVISSVQKPSANY